MFYKKSLSFLLFSALLFSVAPFSTTALSEEDFLISSGIEKHQRACAKEQKEGYAACHARVFDFGKGGAKPNVTSAPVGLTPAQFHSAYNLPTTTNGKQVIAIVDAYHSPTIKSDLDAYSAQFGIPTLPTCSGDIASSPVPCFKQVDQRGGTAFPAVNAGWALEIALDVEVAHAICQNCSILLVESDSNSFANLLAAENRAASLGANVISNSWGANEFSGQLAYDSYFNKPGIAITVSSGDSGYGAQYPSSSPYVTSVGGTTLYLNSDNSYNHETAWSSGGSGCSSFENKPVFQSAIPNCNKRVTADVSAVADPASGAAILNTTPYNGQTGWFKVGGTSLAAPLVGAIYALAGNTQSIGPANSYIYSHASSLRDVTSGKNGKCSRKSNLCNAGPGFDGPTGNGSPNGIGAF